MNVTIKRATMEISDDEVFADNHEAAFKEVIQLAAMCVRYAKHHAPSSVRQFH